VILSTVRLRKNGMNDHLKKLLNKRLFYQWLYDITSVLDFCIPVVLYMISPNDVNPTSSDIFIIFLCNVCASFRTLCMERHQRNVRLQEQDGAVIRQHACLLREYQHEPGVRHTHPKRSSVLHHRCKPQRRRQVCDKHPRS
jgi:hypothetical protein